MNKTYRFIKYREKHQEGYVVYSSGASGVVLIRTESNVKGYIFRNYGWDNCKDAPYHIDYFIGESLPDLVKFLIDNFESEVG